MDLELKHMDLDLKLKHKHRDLELKFKLKHRELELKHKHRELELKLNLSLLKPQSPTRLLLSKIILTSSNFFTSTKVISFIQLASFGAGCYIET